MPEGDERGFIYNSQSSNGSDPWVTYFIFLFLPRDFSGASDEWVEDHEEQDYVFAGRIFICGCPCGLLFFWCPEDLLNCFGGVRFPPHRISDRLEWGVRRGREHQDKSAPP